MTISRLSAGDGYTYYTSVTARGDLDRGSSELGDYYLDGGTPCGEWLGRGIVTLGVEGPVTEQQMRALFGEGLHPNADLLIPQHISAGRTSQQAIEAVRLGRKFARFDSPDNELRDAIAEARSRLQRDLGRDLTPEEQTRTRMRQAGIMFRDRHGRTGSPQEVAKFLATELTQGQNAVAGFDLTFSAPKSVSIAWAIADDAQSRALEEAHTRAMERTITWLEDEIIRTRTGAGGVALHATNGVVGTRFRHWESREGDPQLHDHVVIANRVQITDEQGRAKWLTIDSRGLYKATMNASSLYNRALADELKALGFALRVRQAGNHIGVELKAVPDSMIERFSSRSIAVNARTAQLVADYVRVHGRPPATKELLTIKQRATLETRVAKNQASTRAQLRSRWRAELGSDARAIQQALEADRLCEASTALEASLDIASVADAIIQELSARRSTWDQNHVETRVNIWAAQQPRSVAPDVIQQITAHALNQSSIRISHDPPVPAHTEIQREDGTSIYNDPRRSLYTSNQVLDAERVLLDAAHDMALPAVTAEHFQTALDTRTGPLDDGQIQLARSVACSDQVLTVGIGPAGTGKTTAMRVAIAAIGEAGVQSHGVTVSAAAAEQLHQATGMPTTTIAKWLHDLDTGAVTLRPGDVIVVDEAGMASARNLAAITRHATDADAFIRLIGDDRQLQAIGAGGSLKLIAAEVGAVRLDQVHRFTNPDEAAASLALRDHGDVDFYRRNRRVHGGTITTVFSRVVDGWASDIAAGKTSLMMASTNHDVATLNQMAQDHRAAQGEVDRTTTVELADGSHAGIGDAIVTRQNARHLTTQNGHGFVKNGDLWTLTTIHENGAVTVVDTHGRQITLPADYVNSNTGLGYAITVHRAQGQTVDVGRLIIDDRTTREALYVGLTRGREHNEVHAITQGRTASQLLEHAAANISQERSAHELIRSSQHESSHPATLIRIMHDMQHKADHHRYTTAIRTWAPMHAATILDSPQQSRLYKALTLAEDAGFSAQRILELTCNDLPNNVHDPAGLLIWRINRHLERARELHQAPPHRPLRNLDTSQLDQMIDSASNARRARRSELRSAAKPARLRDGRDVPPWTDRIHGNKSEADLAQDLHRYREQAAALAHSVEEVHEQRRALRTAIFREAPESSRRQALIQQLTHLHERIDGLVQQHHLALRREAATRDEARVRAYMKPGDAAREAHQRSTDAISVHIADRRYTQAQILQRELMLERHWRAFDPDEPPSSGSRALPSWAVPSRGLEDPAMPHSWQEPLREMARNVGRALHTHGAALALDPPTWATRYLGAVPPSESPRRRHWERTAAHIEAWRGLTNHSDPVKALPSAKQSAVMGKEASRHLHTLHAAASDLRRQALKPIAAPAAIPKHYTRPERQWQTEHAKQPLAPPQPRTTQTLPTVIDPQQRITLRLAAARVRVDEARQDLLTARTLPLQPGEDPASRFKAVEHARLALQRAETRVVALNHASRIDGPRGLVSQVRSLFRGDLHHSEPDSSVMRFPIEVLRARVRKQRANPEAPLARAPQQQLPAGGRSRARARERNE